MNYQEALKFYKELEESGKLKEFQEKDPSKMTQREKELFYFDDKKHLYNPYSGNLECYGSFRNPRLKSFSELSDEELEELDIL